MKNREFTRFLHKNKFYKYYRDGQYVYYQHILDVNTLCVKIEEKATWNMFGPWKFNIYTIKETNLHGDVIFYDHFYYQSLVRVYIKEFMEKNGIIPLEK